jgi:hypothetical protein
MGMVKHLVRAGICALLLALSGCGGGGGGDDVDAKATTTTAAASATTTEKAGPELPKFASEFDRVCTTQVGFPGASSYEPVAGIHPMLFFEEHDGKTWVNSVRDFPDGWAVKEDSNFEDNSELKAVQLIACGDRVKETPTGKKCEFENKEKGTKKTLELVNSTTELKVYAATTGKVVKTEMIETHEDECPMFATYQDGDTTYVETPSEDQYTNALKSVVAQQ